MSTTLCILTILSKTRENRQGEFLETGGCAELWPGSTARSSLQFLDQLASTLWFSTGRLQQGLPERVPAFLLTRVCPLQAAEVLIFLLKVSAKLGHPGAPTLRIIIIRPRKCRERSKKTWLHGRCILEKGKAGWGKAAGCTGPKLVAHEHTGWNERKRISAEQLKMSTVF